MVLWRGNGGEEWRKEGRKGGKNIGGNRGERLDDRPLKLLKIDNKKEFLLGNGRKKVDAAKQRIGQKGV